MTLAEVARRHKISRSMLYDWRYRQKLGLLGVAAQFMRLVPMDDYARPDFVPSSTAPQPPATIIDLDGRYRVIIPAGFNMEAAAQLLNGLVVGRCLCQGVGPIHALIRAHVLAVQTAAC